jgi:hypothetical protein
VVVLKYANMKKEEVNVKSVTQTVIWQV